ncbi:MAG: helical backbone metal receptor [Myxococcota bacterium]
MTGVRDALGRTVRLGRPAQRIVSLVPSETLSVVELAGLERLVGRTDYCIEPAGDIEVLPSVGGTKGFDVDAVLALDPDLVLANKEENSRPLVTALIDRGVPVHVSFPRTVTESNDYLTSLCALLGLDDDDGLLRRCRALASPDDAPGDPLPVCVPIWRDPWMTFDEHVFASDMLRLCGAENVFGDRTRRYPLAADLGKRAPLTDEQVAERDTRYPRIVLEEIAERGARAVLFPDEPYAFTESDFAAFDDVDGSTSMHLELVDGKDLFWYGTYVARGIPRLRDAIARISC